MGDEKGGGFEETEEIVWRLVFFYLLRVVRSEYVIFRNAFYNTEERGGDSQELDDLVHRIFCRTEHKKDVQT